jgi:hypothetical protein
MMKIEEIKQALEDAAKPRNQFASLAKQRSAGEHGGHQKNRKRRREEKQALFNLLAGRTSKGEE